MEGGERGGGFIVEEVGHEADEVAAGEGVAAGVGGECGQRSDGDGEGAAVGGFGGDSGGIFGSEVAAVEVVVVAPHLCSLLGSAAQLQATVFFSRRLVVVME